MLHVGVADRAEDLVDQVVELLAQPLADPFQSEWVSVPSLGFRSWLRFRLAERLGTATLGPEGDAGIVANIEMPFPGSLRWRILRAHSAAEGRTDPSDPWEVDRLMWSVLEVMADPSADIDQRLRRSALPVGVTLASRAGPIADLFDRYGVHRPQMVQAWANGDDVDAEGQVLSPDRRWQYHLYRAVRSRVVTRHQGLRPPAERLVEALEMVRSGDLDLAAPVGALEGGLPPRLMLVGQSILTAELGPILEAMSHRFEVHALLLTPSIVESVNRADAVAAASPDTAGPTSWAFPRRVARQSERRTANALLDGWGRRPLESATLLGAGGVVPHPLRIADPGDASRPDALLARLQSDLRSASAPQRDHLGPVPDPSLQIHAAPGRIRQVEVLRDVILGLLRDHPDLREQDIAVMCPQLDDFAPVISAVLGPSAQRGERTGSDPGVPSLRYSVIDRDARSFNPVLAAMQTLIEVLPGRFETTGVRDLLHSPAVRARFGLTTDDLGLLSEWIDSTGIRWGLDGPHRREWKLDASHRANSWAAGADQLMAGIALGDPIRHVSTVSHGGSSSHALAVGGIAPMDLAEGDIASAGRLTAAVRTLAHVHRLLLHGATVRPGSPDGPYDENVLRSAAEWRDVLTEAADLMLAPAMFEDWQRAALDDALANLVIASTDDQGEPSRTELSFGDVRRLLAPALEGPRARADLGYGSVVFARPALLAGVPFRVICILGLDDEALPSATMGGDDLLMAQPFVGDREPRSEARAELLAALQAAGDHLVITCTSRDVRTNVEVPRSVVLDELLEVISATVPARDNSEPSVDGSLVHIHPRQAFHASNFIDDHGPSFSFDTSAREGAAAMLERLADDERPTGPQLLLSVPLPDPATASEVIDLDALKTFFEHPVRYFFKNRLGITIPKAQEEGETQLPTSINNLDGSRVGTDLVRIGMAIGDPESIRIEPDGPSPHLPEEVRSLIDYYASSGMLPPPAAAYPELASITTEIVELLRAASHEGALSSADTSHPIDVPLPDGTRIKGLVANCTSSDRPGPMAVRYARFKAKYRSAALIDLLVLGAQQPEVPWHSVLVTRSAKSGGNIAKYVDRLRAAEPGERQQRSKAALETLVAQYRDGLSYPLPLFEATSCGYSGAVDRSDASPTDREKEASRSWGDFEKVRAYAKECQDVYIRLAYGKVDFYDLLDLDAGGYRFRDESDRMWNALTAAVEPAGEDS